MKIKRIFCIMLSIFSILSLTGCSASVYTQADQQYLVSSLGFSRAQGKFECFVEAIVVNSESTKQGVEKKVLTGVGNTPSESLLSIGGMLSKPLLFDHCAVIAIDTALDRGEVQSVMKYCSQNNEINLAAYIVCTSDIAALFECESVSTLTVGYDLLGVIDRVSELYGIQFHNRYYEVEANLLRSGKSFSLPHFSAKDKDYSLIGANIYSDCEQLVGFSTEEMALYCLITDNFKGGSFGEFKINSSKCYFDCRKEDGGFAITLKIKAELEKGKYSLLRSQLQRFADEYNGFKNKDIFGFSHRIYRKERKLWEEYIKTPSKLLNGSQIKITLEEI